MGSKKPKQPETDYGSLWGSYDRWQQEDTMWMEAQTKSMDKNQARTRARTAASGAKQGSAAYGRMQEGFDKERADLDDRYAEKQNDLTSSIVYQDLQKEYEKQRGEGRVIAMTQFQADQEQAEQDKPYEYKDEWATPGKSYQYYEDDLTGERIYGEDYYADKGFEYEGQTFEEWGAANWGSTEADNPYEDVNPEESEAVQRAKKSASGARSVGGTDDEETNPWL